MRTNWVIGSAAVGLMVGVTAAGVVLLGQSRWKRDTEVLIRRLDGALMPPSVGFFDPDELLPLPPPVQRYLAKALTPGQPIPTTVDLEHVGTFNMSETGENWRPFTSTQHVVMSRPGFVWDARVQMAPGVSAWVHDAYVVGEGILEARALGAIPVMTMRGGGDIALGELMRFFAECAWYPTRLLPSQGVEWAPIDEQSARATLTDGALTLTLTFTFGPDDLIRTVRAESRPRLLDGRTVAAPWQGRFWDYARRDGMLVPIHGEVAWLLPEGEQAYWRGELTAYAAH
jgi:hypothetical protein